MYERTCRAMARQAVALEVLNYHASATVEDVELLVKAEALPSRLSKAHEFDFHDSMWSDLDTCRMVAAMFEETALSVHFHIDFHVSLRDGQRCLVDDALHLFF